MSPTSLPNWQPSKRTTFSLAFAQGVFQTRIIDAGVKSCTKVSSGEPRTPTGLRHDQLRTSITIVIPLWGLLPLGAWALFLCEVSHVE